MADMLKVAILGASGYTGAELVRLVETHPRMQIAALTANARAGATMAEVFPPEARWTHPKGGMFLWGILPEDMDAAEVLKVAVEKKVAFVPGFAFHPTKQGVCVFRFSPYKSPLNTLRRCHDTTG